MAERGEKRVAGAVFFCVFAVLLLGGAYAMWPAELFHTAFSGWTFAMLLRAVAAFVLAILGVEFLAALVVVTLTDR